MKRRARHRAHADPFPHDTDYDFGDANHLPIVPVIVEDVPDAVREETPQPPPGTDSSGTKEDFPPNP